MRRTRRITALALALLAFFIFVGSPFQQVANAVALEAGVIAIIITVLAGLGITFESLGGFDTLNQYVASLFSEYSESLGMSPSDMIRGTQSGVNSSGKILLNNRFITVISLFGSWLRSKFNLVDNTTVRVVSTESSLDGYIVYDTPIYMIADSGSTQSRNKTLIKVTGTSDVNVFFFIEGQGTSVQFIAFSAESFTVQMIFYRNNGAENGRTSFSSLKNETSGDVFVAGAVNTSAEFTSKTNADLAGLIYHSGLSRNNVLSIIGNNQIESGDFPIDIQVGVIDIPTDDSTFTDDTAAVVDISAPWGSSLDEIEDDIIPGLVNSGELEAEVELESEETVEEQVDNTTSYVSNNPNSYRSEGLATVFPFCIPFDIYAFFECLAADPVAPAFTWRFYVPGICDEELTVDLAPFNTVAQIVRTMELLAFIVGLALVTRDKFLRG